MQVHATVVELDGTGVLLRGAPGSGKSDLALRLIDGGARLVADDRCELRLEGGRVMARAPRALAGLLEVRGLGVVPVPCVPRAALALIVDLVPSEAVERMPAASACALLGVELPRIALSALEASCAAKVRLAARNVSQGIMALK